MKNIIRAFALSLVITGAVASTHLSSASAQSTIAPKLSALPVPSCEPGVPDGCGIGQIAK